MSRLAWLTPDTLPVEDPVAIRVLIPNGPYWRAQLRGVLGALADSAEYEGFGELSVEEAASAWLALLATNLELVECNESNGMVAPIGSIIAWPSGTPPDGWLLCDGAEYVREAFPDLFALVGESFGVGTIGTFRVPNLKGNFILGADETIVLASTGGESEHQLTVGELPAHAHREQTAGPSGTSLAGASRATIASGTGVQAMISTNIPNTSGAVALNTQNTGNGEAHNNLPPYLALNYIIRAF